MHDLLRQIIAELKGSWRYRWIAMTTAWLVCLVGWLVVYGITDSYESAATVYVDTDSALKPLLAQLTVDSDVLGRVDMVTAVMLGRPQLEKVARETDMHLRARDPEELDGMILAMRKRIEIINPRNTPNVFEIKYHDESPKIAQAVVTTLLNIFVEDSFDANQRGTQQAQQFLRGELTSLEADLTESEARLVEFKKRNVGRMPSEGGGYFSRLRNEMDLLDATRSELRLATKRRDNLRQQLSGEQPTIHSANGPQSALDKRIVQTQNRLEELQLRFTDLHPDVIAVRAALEQLKEQQDQQLEALRNADGASVASDNPVFQNIQIELTNVNVEIATLTAQVSDQQRRIAALQDLMDVLPEVEAELSRLTRDYDVKQSQYQSLLQRLEVAELSESAGQSEDVTFRIIDPPFLPGYPTAPNRPLLLGLVLLAGLVVGGGLAFLANQLQPVFNDAIELREATGLPVLGSVFMMQTRDRSRERFRQLAAFGSALLGLCLIFVVVLLLHGPGSRLVQSLV